MTADGLSNTLSVLVRPRPIESILYLPNRSLIAGCVVTIVYIGTDIAHKQRKLKKMRGFIGFRLGVSEHAQG
jgi:hypothetical protein